MAQLRRMTVDLQDSSADELLDVTEYNTDDGILTVKMKNGELRLYPFENIVRVTIPGE